ncbi:hypothetical protein LQF12_01375 [Ruania suaedae]|uniref:vWA domain-containing protein n=1 Tax=Ruania suaedae TaxID=2897774 RepID=UPI001E2F6CD8|nr:hypothetical protein [Ruania suaedae]UFU03292.1 hypothetical protein LQF12_01375 [Ruania suaedae]
MSALLAAVLVAGLSASSLPADAEPLETTSATEGASTSALQSTEPEQPAETPEPEQPPASEPTVSEDADDAASTEDVTEEPAESAGEDTEQGESDSSPTEQVESGEDETAESLQSGRQASRQATTEDAPIGVMSVPSPTNTTAVINVNVGGSRTGNTAVAPLAGVTLRLYTGGSAGPSAPVTASWATCVSDSDGDCSFSVPQTQPLERYRDCFLFFCGDWIVTQPAGENNGAQFWVKQEGAPAGWYANTALVTGSAANNNARDYTFRAPALTAGQTYESGAQFMNSNSSSPQSPSTGIWQNGRANPQLPQTCEAGLRVALVLDLSGSVNDAGAVGDLRNSAKGFVDALAGTGSSIGLYTFATTAPRNGENSGRNYDPLPIDSGSNQQTIKDRIDRYDAGGGTNWDRGIWQVANDSDQYDLAIIVTDGLATFYGSGSNPAGPGNNTRFIETEQAIYSANALKAEGTRVLAVGVGDGISGNAANLAAVSGPTPYQQGSSANNADYFQAGWQQLGPLLSELARGATCQATVSVTKLAQEYGDPTADPAAGWTFAAARTAGSGTITPSATQTTGATGTVDYRIAFASTSATATVRLTELPTAAQQAEGWALENVTCTVNGSSRAVTPTGNAVSLTGITRGDTVACTFVNVQQLVPDIEIVKRAWDTPSAPVPAGTPEVQPGADVVSGKVLTWTYLVTNTGETPLTGISVTDDQLPGGVTCPGTTLAVGASMTCTASGPVTALAP